MTLPSRCLPCQVSINQAPMHLYDQIMAKIPHLGRPLAIGFRRKMEGLGNTHLEPREHSKVGSRP